MRFLMVDRITSFEPGVRAAAIKNVTLSEDFFADHFPHRPIMPGVLMVEGMAQLSGLLIEEGLREEKGDKVKAILCMIEKSKFRRPVIPGDTVEYQAEVISLNEAGARASAKAFLEGRLVAQCTLVFSFLRVDDPELEARRREVIDFWLRSARRNEKD
jgi:beta-hydroxyacyl-ACP dehydratase FabZ